MVFTNFCTTTREGGVSKACTRAGKVTNMYQRGYGFSRNLCQNDKRVATLAQLVRAKDGRFQLRSRSHAWSQLVFWQFGVRVGTGVKHF